MKKYILILTANLTIFFSFLFSSFRPRKCIDREDSKQLWPKPLPRKTRACPAWPLFLKGSGEMFGRVSMKMLSNSHLLMAVRLDYSYKLQCAGQLGRCQSRLAVRNCKKSPNQETGLGNRGHLKVVKDTKLVLNKRERLL